MRQPACYVDDRDGPLAVSGNVARRSHTAISK